jgi:hypothetical protein
MNKKVLIVVAFCFTATLLIPPVFAPPANNLFEMVQNIQTGVTTIISDLSTMSGVLTNVQTKVDSIISALSTMSGEMTTLYQKLWSDSDSVKSDTSRITTTQANLGEWILPAYTVEGFYDIVNVWVGDFYGDGVAQFTVTAKSEYLDGILEVWVDVGGDASADMPALKLEATVDENYGTTTFVGSWFSIRLNLGDDPPTFDKQIEWAYMVVAPPGAEIHELTSPPPPPAPTPPPS